PLGRAAVVRKMKTMVVDGTEAREQDRASLERARERVVLEQGSGAEPRAFDGRGLFGGDTRPGERTGFARRGHSRGIRLKGAFPGAELADEKIVERAEARILVLAHVDSEFLDEGRDFVPAQRRGLIRTVDLARKPGGEKSLGQRLPDRGAVE